MYVGWGDAVERWNSTEVYDLSMQRGLSVRTKQLTNVVHYRPLGFLNNLGLNILRLLLLRLVRPRKLSFRLQLVQDLQTQLAQPLLCLLFASAWFGHVQLSSHELGAYTETVPTISAEYELGTRNSVRLILLMQSNCELGRARRESARLRLRFRTGLDERSRGLALSLGLGLELFHGEDLTRHCGCRVDFHVSPPFGVRTMKWRGRGT